MQLTLLLLKNLTFKRVKRDENARREVCKSSQAQAWL